jgi:hypothetical protein
VDDGNANSSEAIFIISGACPPPAPSVWYVCIVLPKEFGLYCLFIYPLLFMQ